MSHYVCMPSDPDCTKCDGSGYVGHGDFWLAHCDCRSFANVPKVRARCQHEFACPHCGATIAKTAGPDAELESDPDDYPLF